MSRKLVVALCLAVLSCLASRERAVAAEATPPPPPSPAAGHSRPCEAAVEKFCAQVTPGKGAILDCLKPHMSEVSEPCRKTMERIEKRRIMIQDRQRHARTMRQGMHTPKAAAAAATPEK